MSIVYHQPTEATETFRVCINTTFEAHCNTVMVRPREINKTPVGNSYTNNKVQVRRSGSTMILTPYAVQKLAYQLLLSQLTVAEVPKDFELRTIDYVTREQAVQDQRTANMATQVFRAVSVQTPQHNKDMIAVKVDGREDVAVFEKTSDQHDETAQDIFKALKAAESQRYPLAHFNTLCQHRLTRPLSQHEFDTFCWNQQEEDEKNNESYKTRVLSMYKQNPYLFSRATATAAVDTAADDADDGDDPKRSFNGHCVDCIDSGIPHGYRTMIITHLEIKGVSAAKAILHMLISMKTSPLPSTLNASVKMP
ncbi:hypothetical protein KAF25_006278 [Fusarium avenaceum]|uniref:Uncharacterized protein n=1 Tax=Fusarium avenaceum TaxID=40199 RepID=A0A9P7HC42_9HYPO|nr:hypothetical protein KAF25_006278 [Fusarium avenaceum]